MAKPDANGSVARAAFRLGLSGAIALALVFIGTWTAGQLPTGPTSLFVELFTSAPPYSVDALFEGATVAALMGFFGAAFVSLAHSGIASLEQRGLFPPRHGGRAGRSLRERR